MKGKILSILFCLMLAFGMIIASCDDGAMPKDPSSDDGKNVTTEFHGGLGAIAPSVPIP